MMDHRKRCKVGSTCWHFWFAQRVIEFNPTASERVFIGHHTFQSENHRIGCKGSFGFHNQKNNDQDAQLIGNRLVTKLLAKPTKEMEREKEMGIYKKITPPKAFVEWEGWKV